MNAFLSIYRNSRIVRDIVNRIVLIELTCFVVILLLMVFILQPILNRQSKNVASDMTMYISNTVNSMFESIMTASQYIASSSELHHAIEKYDMEKTDQAQRDVKLVLNQLASCQPWIRGVIFEDAEHTRFDSITNLSEHDRDALQAEWYQTLGNADYGQKFFVAQDDSVTFFYAKITYIGSKKCFITIIFNAGSILNDIKEYSTNMFSGFALTDRGLNILYMDGSTSVFDHDFSTLHSENTLSANHGVFFASTIQSNIWKLILYADNSAIFMRYQSYLLVTALLFVLLFLLTVFLIAPAVYKKIKPINTLSSAMGKVVQGDMLPIPEVLENNEIGDLSRIFNHMICSLNANFNTILEHEKTEQKMRYGLLISQIDPHFIYNTMTILNTLARDRRTDDIIEINSALIKILQDRLRVNGIQIFDSVAHEAEIVKKYLLIQKHRFRNNVFITWLIDEDLLDVQIPKNIIQPLVENSLFHGLIDEVTGELSGTLSIAIVNDHTYIVIRVSDSGKGIKPEKVQEILDGFTRSDNDRSSHIGLRNVYGRLKHLFHENCYFRIDGSQGTVVTIGINRDTLQNVADMRIDYPSG